MTSPESPLLRRMNRLKDAADESMLTEAQRGALLEIKQHRKDEARFINLHGPRYAGKTFVCWILCQSSDWFYNQAVPDNPDTPTVVYDHGDPERRATRQLRNHASIHGLATTVYVTRRPADELYPRVELQPGDEHYEQVAKNWEELGLTTDTAPAPIQQ